MQGVVPGPCHHQLQQPDHTVWKPVLEAEIALLERDSKADGPRGHPHAQAEQAVPLRAVPHQVGAYRLPLELGVSLPHRQGAPVEVTGLKDIERSLQDFPLAAAKHPETIGQAGWRRAGENAPMPPLQTRNSGVCVVQVIWPPSDHLSKSPWILERCCLYHASSFASSLWGQKESEANPITSWTWARRFPRQNDQQEYHRGHQGAIACHQPPAAVKTKDICVEMAPAESPPVKGGTLQSSAYIGVLWFTARGSCTPSSRLLWTQQISTFQDFPLPDIWDFSEWPWDWKGETTPHIKRERFLKGGKYHLFCHSVKVRKVSSHFSNPLSNKKIDNKT